MAMSFTASVSRLARLTATVAAALVLPLSAGATQAAAAAVPEQGLPVGVFRLGDSQPCPQGMFCLYRDYDNQGPAYGIAAGRFVDLRELPMEGGANGSTAANHVSSWVNNTDHVAFLIDEEGRQARQLYPNQRLQEPQATNDTVDVVRWTLW